jgi:ribose 5-phosphate isomerase B
MPAPTIAIAADHAGFELKATLKQKLEESGHIVLDLGTDGPRSVDYPDFAAALATALAEGRAEICGSGIGISIAANRHRHVRAALCHDDRSARLARQHNDANVLALGRRFTDPGAAALILQAFLVTSFEGGRHAGRVAKAGSVTTDWR